MATNNHATTFNGFYPKKISIYNDSLSFPELQTFQVFLFIDVIQLDRITLTYLKKHLINVCSLK